MRAKSLILLVIALGCGMVAAVAVSKVVMQPKAPSAPAEANVEIFVAVKDLPTAQKISAENVKLEKWPKNRLPEGAILDLESVEGKFTNQMIFANEPILAKKIADSRESFSATIPSGYRVFDIKCSAGYIKPGDHVDIVGTFKTKGRSAPETRTVMRNVQVLGINGITTRDSDGTVKRSDSTFQLIIKESQLEALTLANKLGDLTLNLRPFGEKEEDTDNGESFLSWLETNDQAKPVSTGSSEQRQQQVMDAVQSIFGGAKQPPANVPPPEPKNEMLIMTPQGVTRYEWSNDSELPQEVTSKSTSAPQSSYGWPGSGNVPSGYGGYSPTYPTSTTTGFPGSASGAPFPPATGAPAIPGEQPEEGAAAGKSVN